MDTRAIAQLIPACEVTEGAGVTVHRTLGTPARQNLDPFLLLDHFSSANPDDYVAGFPDHPHRGFVTLTYMLDGHMVHGDSMGNQGDLRSGGAQWMKAASGVIHSEMPKQTAGLMRGFQLWINLPAAEKMSDPAYQEIAPEAVPVVQSEGMRVRLLAGEYAARCGPIRDPNTNVTYLDVSLDAGHGFAREVERGDAGFLYVFEGTARVTDTEVAAHNLAILGPGERIEIQAGTDGARFIVVSGRPVGEPVVQYGPFVMNTREQIQQAFADYRDGRLVQKRAEFVER